MATKSNPAHPLARGLALTALVLAGFVLSLSSASACQAFRPDPSIVNFANVVREAANITIARVTMASPLALDHAPSYEDDIARFNLQTVERIKGNAPAEFTLDGVPAKDLSAFIARAQANHNGMGEFWWRFGAGCGRFPHAYAVGAEFLVFSDANGKPLAWRDHYSELLPSRDDEWLRAVRALASSPTLKKGRKAKLTDFLASAQTILVSRTTRCEKDGRKQSIRQIGGQPLPADRLTEIDNWAVTSRCEPGRTRLTIAFATGYHASIALEVSGDQGTVDFTGFIDGTLQGLSYEAHWAPSGLMPYGWLFYSQIDLEGPRVWRLVDIEAMLRSAAQSEH